MPRYNAYQGMPSFDYPALQDNLKLADSYDEDIEFYDDEFYEYDGEFEIEDEYLDDSTEYEPDMIDDTAGLAEALREVVHESYQHARPEQMEDALLDMLEQMTPAEGFNFVNALKGAAKNPMLMKIAGTALPVAGGALGTMIGGPVGTAMGSKLGQVAGQAISGGKKPIASTTPPIAPAFSQGGSTQAIAGGERPSASTFPSTAQASPQGGSVAAAQLLQLTQNPDMLKSLLSLTLGSHGTSSIPVGKDGPSVPVGAFMNMLGHLAGKAATDADQLYGESDEKYDYLLDSQSSFGVDPTVPEDRAQALYKFLLTTENDWLTDEISSSQPWSIYIPFGKGTKLLVKYEHWTRNYSIGNGSILEITPELLKAKIHIDKWDSFGFHIPETYVTLMVEYVQDGPGNKAIVVVNGMRYADNNVTIRSGKNTRDILISINFLGQKVDQISINCESAEKAKLILITGGDQYVLILTKDNY